jgi:hypothetical protein
VKVAYQGSVQRLPRMCFLPTFVPTYGAERFAYGKIRNISQF